MRDHYIFDIPIYRCTQEIFEADIERELEERRKRAYDDQDLPRPSTDEEKRHRLFVEGLMRDTMGGCWQFNQIVGWMRLYAQGYAVGGQHWMVDKKRYSRTMPHKRFQCLSGSNMLAVYVPHPSPSNVIYEAVLKSLEDYADQKYMKRRCVDLSVFKRVGPYINWHDLLEDQLQASNRAMGERMKGN